MKDEDANGMELLFDILKGILHVIGMIIKDLIIFIMGLIVGGIIL